MKKKVICHNYFRIKIFVEKKNNFFLNISVTSEIPEYPSHIRQLTNIWENACVTCEFVIQSIAKEIGNSKTRDEIEMVVHGICNHIHGTLTKYCFEFAIDYVDAIISMLSEVGSKPKEFCTSLGLCKMKTGRMQGTVIKVIITIYNFI